MCPGKGTGQVSENRKFGLHLKQTSSHLRNKTNPGDEFIKNNQWKITNLKWFLAVFESSPLNCQNFDLVFVCRYRVLVTPGLPGKIVKSILNFFSSLELCPPPSWCSSPAGFPASAARIGGREIFRVGIPDLLESRYLQITKISFKLDR